MKIAVFGGTGGTGKQFIRQALENGHEVTALVRTPDKLNMPHPKLDIVQGNVRNRDDVRGILSGQDAILYAIGGGENTGKTNIRALGTRQILMTLAERGEKPHLVIISSLGTGESKYQMGFFIRMFITYLLRHPLADHNAQETLVQKSDLPWTILRPAGLNNDPANGKIIKSYAPQKVKAQGSVSRADVAAIALQAIETKSHIHEAVTLTLDHS